MTHDQHGPTPHRNRPAAHLRDASAYWEPDPAHQATSVWLAAMHDAKAQRRGRYLAGSATHPAKMLPDAARHAIVHYTRPGDLVLDPMCGIGTTLVEAIRTGRRAIGVEYEPRWAAIARGNVALARRHGAPGRAWIRTADARGLPHLLRPAATDHRPDEQAAAAPRPVTLILTSPPYGAHTHGHGRTRPGQVIKNHYRYSPTRRGSANLAHHHDLADLIGDFTAVLTGAVALLRPGGHVVITTRPYRRGGELIDLPGAVTDAARTTGLTPIERCVVPLAGLRHGRLVTRATFFQRLTVRNARAAGVPLQIPLHEDLLVFRHNPAGHADPRSQTASPTAPQPSASAATLPQQQAA